VTSEFYSVEQVAERLGLHVRTVRAYVRDGKLKAVRIGKQYRITRADLEAFTGGAVPQTARESAGRTRRAEVSAVVEVDAISPARADRIGNTVVAAAEGLRLQVIYDAERAHLKIIIFGDPAGTAAMLQIVATLLENGT